MQLCDSSGICIKNNHDVYLVSRERSQGQRVASNQCSKYNINSRIILYICNIIWSFFFQLHAVSHTHSRVGRGNLVLRHYVPHFLPDGGIAC